MLIAVQGCCHGSLSAIYDSIAQFESTKNQKVDLLLLCGDFQALRSEHDFASLAVPPKYHALGTFHQYYSGKRRAPVLTLVIGGNHEASNYMWELYHGGWLAPNIYYLGAAGSVYVNGLRVVGASGIYKDHDYGKGHFETVPYSNSTMRSIYHIRQYDVAKLMQLPPDPSTVFMSHDWPITIPHHGDTQALLRRKPFFRQEVQTNTLGSPPLLILLKHVQPQHWFAAHLHVKFAAVYRHGPDGPLDQSVGRNSQATMADVAIANPDEIKIGDDDEADAATSGRANDNPDEIHIEDDDEIDVDTENRQSEVKQALTMDESADLVEAARRGDDPHAAEGVIGITSTNAIPQSPPTRKPGDQPVAGPSSRVTRFLALDKCGPGKDFIQFLDIPTPSPSPPGQVPHLTFDPHWLAITRALHPYLSLEIQRKPLPRPDEMERLVEVEWERIQRQGLHVPNQTKVADGHMASTESTDTGETVTCGLDGMTGPSDGAVELVWEKGPVEISRIQQFWPTAPAHGQPGGSSSKPSSQSHPWSHHPVERGWESGVWAVHVLTMGSGAWYTNPQTEAFCGMLGIENKINPAPPSPGPPASIPPTQV